MKHGGKREGAGRPSIGKKKKLNKNITLRPDHLAWLEGKNASQEIEKALDAHIEKERVNG